MPSSQVLLILTFSSICCPPNSWWTEVGCTWCPRMQIIHQRDRNSRRSCWSYQQKHLEGDKLWEIRIINKIQNTSYVFQKMQHYLWTWDFNHWTNILYTEVVLMNYLYMIYLLAENRKPTSWLLKWCGTDHRL